MLNEFLRNGLGIVVIAAVADRFVVFGDGALALVNRIPGITTINVAPNLHPIGTQIAVQRLIERVERLLIIALQHAQQAEVIPGPRIATIQNPFSLLNRLYEVGLSEIGMRENVGLLAYSPLGFGALSGKYLHGTPENSRMKLFPNFVRYTNENSFKATKLYQDLAHSLGLTLTEMAIAFVNHQEFVTSTIIGATTIDQLEENINAFDVMLTDAVLEEIDKIQEMIPNPAP